MDAGRRVFLTAEWRHLVLLNYPVDPALVQPLVPDGTEIDYFKGRTFVSLVGFRFLRTKVLGVPVPLHRDFDEVNLRFYIRRRVEGGELRRGVGFVREIVPRYAIAKLARDLYNEKYISLPMSHRLAPPRFEYAWRQGGSWSSVSLETAGEPALPREGSIEQFIVEHYWGYSAQADGGTVEYRVEHVPWRVWPAREAGFQGDAVGEEFARIVSGCPETAFLAEGSPVLVYAGRRLA